VAISSDQVSQVDPQRIAAIVEAVVRRLRSEGYPIAAVPTVHTTSANVQRPGLARFTNLATSGAASVESAHAPRTTLPVLPGGSAVFADLDRAVAAATAAQRALLSLPLATRDRAVEAMREAARQTASQLAEIAVQETKLGRVDDKVKKNLLVANATPGVEDLEPRVYTGDHGLTLEERAPLGVLASITPSTNPSETIINNAISMIAAGNAVVFGPHPGAKGVSNHTVEILNRAVVAAGGPAGLITSLAEPTIELAQRLMRHDGVRAVVVTGGPGVVSEAMKTGKKVFAAGPGNPPVVVDETADIDKAGRDIVAGASFDNNIICTDEKEIFVVDGVANALKAAMCAHGAFELKGPAVDRLRAMVLEKDNGPRKHGVVNRAWIGQDATKILAELGVSAPPTTRLIVVETPPDHPFVWTELLMPVMALVRVRNVDEAIDLAREAEHGYRHTASMWSRNIEKLSKMARIIDCSIFVKNGPNYAGLGFGGEGFTSFTIAGRTGEGMTTARTFTRLRRCVLVDYFRIV
jgi:acyl-CoA reductase-like NAD-dependent aldehyde dehydrogenase